MSRRIFLGGIAMGLSAPDRASAAERTAGSWASQRPARMRVKRAADAHPVKAPPGVRSLHLQQEPDGLFLQPATYHPDRPAPLLVLLHGASGRPAQILRPIVDLLDARGILTLVPASAGVTWDAVVERRGRDMRRMERALQSVLDSYAVDLERIAIGGFSDGASFALALGLTQGDIFRRVLAFSPGFLKPYRRDPNPAVFLVHGTRDDVLPIGQASRPIARTLKRSGYDLEYREFDGGHAVPRSLFVAGLDWMLAPSEPTPG